MGVSGSSKLRSTNLLTSSLPAAIALDGHGDHQDLSPGLLGPTQEDPVVALRRTGHLIGSGSGRRRRELGQLLVAQVDDVVAERTVQQLELLAGHEDGRIAAAR